MARSVTAKFKAHWLRMVGQPEILRVQYKLRYWNGAAFALQAAWTTLEGDQFVSVGRVPQQLDVPNQNVFKASVVTLKFPNTQNEWIEHAGSPSIFAANDESPDGYELERSWFRIQFGYKYDDGTEEVVNEFTGLATGRWKPSGAVAEVEVQSRDLQLEADAEDVSQAETLENCIPPTGDGSITDFESTSTGVDHSTRLEVDGAPRAEGSGYRTSNENEVASAGNTGRLALKLAAAPAAGKTVKVSVVKWLQNQAVDVLIGLLLDVAEITAGERSIAPVIFPGSVSGSKTMDTQAQWQAGTVFTNTEADRDATGVLQQKWFLMDDFAATLAAWTVSGASIVGGKLQCAAGQYAGFNAAPNMTGSWETIIDATAGVAEFRILAYGGYYAGGSGTSMYFLNVGAASAVLYREDHISSPGPRQLTPLLTVLRAPGAADVWRITRDSDGLFLVSVNGANVSGLGVNDTTIPTDVNPGYGTTLYCSSGTVTFDDVLYSFLVVPLAEASNKASTLVYESQEFDLLAAPVAWGAMSATYTAAGATLALKTNVAAASGGPYDGYVTTSVGLVPQSALRRYAKVRAELALATVRGILTGPSIDTLVLNFSTSSIFLALANFAGKRVSAAEQRLVKLCDYERGFDGDGNYFFRPKTTSGSYVVHLTQENGIVDVLDYDTGIPDRVRNVGRVRSGGFVAVYDKTTAGEVEPTSERRHGRTVGDEDFSDITLANDADIRTARARAIYERNRVPPLWIRLRIWIVPWLEASDIVRVSLFDHPMLRAAYAGDPLLRATDAWSTMGEPGNVVARDRDFKCLEYVPDYDTNLADVLLEAL